MRSLSTVENARLNQLKEMVASSNCGVTVVVVGDEGRGGIRMLGCIFKSPIINPSSFEKDPKR